MTLKIIVFSYQMPIYAFKIILFTLLNFLDLSGTGTLDNLLH